MYNAVTNGWKNFEHQITFDVRQPKTACVQPWSACATLSREPPLCERDPLHHVLPPVHPGVRRAASGRSMWTGTAIPPSVSPYILEQFEKEVGYKFRPEYHHRPGLLQQPVPRAHAGNTRTSRLSSGARWQNWPGRWWTSPTSCGKEAMMFLGDHWIGTEPYHGRSSPSIGLDAVVGSVGNGSTLRLISDIPGVKYTEGRFLPYFFPDTFHEGGDPVGEARGQLGDRPPRHPAQAHRPHRLRRLSEAGVPVSGVHRLCGERVQRVPSSCTTTSRAAAPVCLKTCGRAQLLGQGALLGLPHGAPCPVPEAELQLRRRDRGALAARRLTCRFISFDDIGKQPDLLDGLDVLISVGDGDTAHTGGRWWENARGRFRRARLCVAAAADSSVWASPADISIRDIISSWPAVLGVEKETGFTLGYGKFNWEEHPDHFLLEDCQRARQLRRGQEGCVCAGGYACTHQA